MDSLHYALLAVSVVLLVALVFALNAKDRMKLTAESAIMRNDELNGQLKKERELADKRVKTVESLESKIIELENIIKDGKADNKRLIERLQEAESSVYVIQKDMASLTRDRDRFKALAEEGERTIQDQAKQIKELTEGDASGEVGRGKRGRFVSKRAS